MLYRTTELTQDFTLLFKKAQRMLWVRSTVWTFSVLNYSRMFSIFTEGLIPWPKSQHLIVFDYEFTSGNVLSKHCIVLPWTLALTRNHWPSIMSHRQFSPGCAYHVRDPSWRLIGFYFDRVMVGPASQIAHWNVN